MIYIKEILKSMIHIYCGDGKGKTTAALGLAIRAAGSGMNVHIVQFLKGNPTSELQSIELIPNITISRPQKNYGFTFSMTDSQKAELTVCHNALLYDAIQKIKSGEIQLLVLDEFFAAYNNNLIDRTLAEKTVFEKYDNCELVLTGRNPSENFINFADYVSEIKAVKHPFANGITARKGIEY